MTFIQMMKIMGGKLYQTVDQTPSYFYHTKATYPYADPLNLQKKNSTCMTIYKKYPAHLLTAKRLHHRIKKQNKTNAQP